MFLKGEIMKKYFTGRLARMPFFVANVVLLLVEMLLLGTTSALAFVGIAGVYASVDNMSATSWFWVVILGVILLSFIAFLVWITVLSLGMVVRRLHDANLSGWFGLLFLALGIVPSVMFYLGDPSGIPVVLSVFGYGIFLILAIIPGSATVNRYGGPPLRTSLREWIFAK